MKELSTDEVAMVKPFLPESPSATPQRYAPIASTLLEIWNRALNDTGRHARDDSNYYINTPRVLLILFGRLSLKNDVLLRTLIPKITYIL